MYLDHAASTTIRPVALDALDDAYRRFDRNASGLHSSARDAKNALEDARERAAVLLGSDSPHDLIFTGSGTEADNLAVIGAALAGEGTTIAVSGIEHKAVLMAAASMERFGYEVLTLPVTPSGVVEWAVPADVDPESLSVVSVMLANNEIGTIQPVDQIGSVARSVNPAVVVHVDAAQAFSSLPVTFQSTGADMISLASHKLGGPKGVGLLALRSGTKIEPIIHGGGQEAGRRSGTYNVAGVVAMVVAMEAASDDRAAFVGRTSAERDSFESAILNELSQATVTASHSGRLSHVSHIRFDGVLAETLLIRLDQAELAAAAGSACQSGAVEPSHVLKAIGFSDEEARQCIRFSFGWDTPKGEGLRAARIVLDEVAGLL